MAAVAAAVAMASIRRKIASMKERTLKNLETNIDQALVHLHTGDIDNPAVYSRTCMKLGSSIDSAIAMNVSPSSFHLPRLLLIVKEVYRRKPVLLQPSLMLLMLPIKAACQSGWFSDGDKDGLLMIAKEVSYGFCNIDKMTIEPSNAHSSVSNIVSRFYPTMKVEHILTTFDVKAGYGAFVADFHISIGTTPRTCRNLWLLVAQLDNMETAACITNPLNVDFLINGCAVPNRTKNDMEKEPQLPSDITKMIKYGVNLLQVFGDFDGQYIIALAFMNLIASPDPPKLQDYLRPMSDCAIIEMSSRISLYCPISQHRIKTPVKGNLCKHPQCFDYNHFIEVNSIKPTWKCPLCNNSVCYQDLRIDQDFLKILNEVAEDVHDVIISEDGSWMAAESDSHASVTTAAVSAVQTPVNLCTDNQAQNTFSLMPTAASLGQTQVNTCTTNQGQSTTMFTPPAATTTTAVFPGQTQVNSCTTNQGQSTTTVTPPTSVIKVEASPGQTQVTDCTNMQAKRTKMLTPPAGSPDHIRVNTCASNQGQSTTFTPPATVKEPPLSPGETQVNVCTTTQAKSSMMLTPPEGSTDQIQINFCTPNQGLKESPHSPGEAQVNVCTTAQAITTPLSAPSASRSSHSFASASSELRKGGKQGGHTTTPGESQPTPNISRVAPTQLPEASDDGMPSGRMRGSLRGDKLQAARLQYLAPPQQPARANEPWSRPPVPSLPLPFLTSKPPTNASASDHA